MSVSRTQRSDVTELLLKWSEGDREALDRLMPLVYDELRRLARHHLRLERNAHTLQPTALTNELYLRLVKQERVQWKNRAHFFAIAAQLMRRVLVDHARRRHADKRGGKDAPLPLDEAVARIEERDVSLVALEDALSRLEELDPRQARIVELRYFGGLTIEEAAEVLEVSPSTVRADWTVAKRWLYRDLR